MTTRRSFLTGSAALAFAATLAACSDDLPTTSGETASASAQPVLDSDRLTTILTRVQTGLDAADAAKDSSMLSGYLTGPAARVRGEEYVVATAAGDDTLVDTFTTTSQAGTVGRTTDFPRTAITVTEPASDGEVPYLLVLSQGGARENFQLWSWARLFGGIEVPSTAAASAGSEQVDGSTTGLVATPQEVLDAYVDALNNPTGGNGTAFADDPIRQRVASERAVDLASQGTVTVTAAAGSDGIRGLRTSENGALVMTTLSFSTVYSLTVAGATITVGDLPGKLLGDGGKVVGTVTASYDVEVAFAIPSADAGGQSTAIGGAIVLAGVSRDDSQAPAAG